jgi:hypothetical protein
MIETFFIISLPLTTLSELSESVKRKKEGGIRCQRFEGRGSVAAAIETRTGDDATPRLNHRDAALTLHREPGIVRGKGV